MHTHDFCGEQSTNLHMRDIGKSKYMYAWFFFCGGGHLGAPIICGGGGGRAPQAPVATPLGGVPRLGDFFIISKWPF